jgi:excisionase family DNA binding protein
MARGKARDFMTLAEAAAKIELSPSTLRNQVHHGRLRAEKIGKTWVVTEAEVARYKRESRGKQKGRYSR